MVWMIGKKRRMDEIYTIRNALLNGEKVEGFGICPKCKGSGKSEEKFIACKKCFGYGFIEEK